MIGSRILAGHRCVPVPAVKCPLLNLEALNAIPMVAEVEDDCPSDRSPHSPGETEPEPLLRPSSLTSHPPIRRGQTTDGRDSWGGGGAKQKPCGAVLGDCWFCPGVQSPWHSPRCDPRCDPQMGPSPMPKMTYKRALFDPAMQGNGPFLGPSIFPVRTPAP